MEPNLQNNSTSTPEIQDMILSTQIGCIAAELAKRLDINPAEALSLFYESKTCADLHNKETGLYLLSNLYIVDEFMLEYQLKS